MSKNLQIGNTIYKFPEQGDREGWGEDVTDWATGVTDALSTVQGPNDILQRTSTLANNQSSPASIPGLSFNTAEVIHVKVTFLIKRVYDSGATTIVESGNIMGNYDGTTFTIAVESVGADTGVEIDVLNSGQFTYTSTDLPNHVSTTCTFEANTLDD